MVLAFIMLTIATARMGKNKRSYHFLIRIALCLAVALLLYYVAPQMTWRGRIILTMQAHNLYNPMLMLKISIVAIVAIMYSKIYELIFQRQNMVIENEQLKNEVLVSQYTGLVNQINPHFFFNSLNSLAMLVREHDHKRALEYIDQLSYTFRYIIQNGQSSTTTLKDEIAFAEAYAYLFKIRYADKLFFNFDIDPAYNNWTLPALSLQPLIGNAVKHNSITTKNPLHVTIRTVGSVLEIENPKHPKLDVEPSTGIGLENLKSRWQIITGHTIEIVDEAERFVVRMPLDNSVKK